MKHVVILTSSHFGYPLSSTHVISGGIVGAGAADRVSAVRWGVAGNIFAAWVLTLPGAAVFGGVAYWLASRLGSGAVGPLVLCALALGLVGTAMLSRRRRVGQVLST